MAEAGNQGGGAWRNLSLAAAGAAIALALCLQLLADSTRSDDPARQSPAATAPAADGVLDVAFGRGRGTIGAGWQLYFNQPQGSDPATYADGIDGPLVNAIDALRDTLDIAAFELNSDRIYEAILAAHERGIQVRVVADDAHGLEDPRDDHLRRLRAAGVAVVDDGRTALMHNKFMILDGKAVWSGSWNFTRNGTYRNNNNVFVMDSRRAAAAFQAEFDEMFMRREFGVRSRDDGVITIELGGARISIVFGPEADEISLLRTQVAAAASEIRLMTFVFSLEALASAILEKLSQPQISVRGVFDRRSSRASWSQLPALHCAGADMREDGNPYAMHHKVIIIDADTVITGSFNFSKSAAQSNDETLLIIHDEVIAGRYIDEWQRIWDSALSIEPGDIECG